MTRLSRTNARMTGGFVDNASAFPTTPPAHHQQAKRTASPHNALNKTQFQVTGYLSNIRSQQVLSSDKTLQLLPEW